MFGGRKRKAIQAAIEAVHPIVRTLEMTGGLPHGFWEDPYVTGYLTTVVGLFAKMSSNGKVAGEELGEVVRDVMAIISGRDGTEIISQVRALQKSQDPDFSNGSTNAQKVVLLAYGLDSFDDDPDVERARRLGANDDFAFFTGPISDAAKTAGALQTMLFYEAVRERLGESEN